MLPGRRHGQVVRQRIANPLSPVRIWVPPFERSLQHLMSCDVWVILPVTTPGESTVRNRQSQSSLPASFIQESAPASLCPRHDASLNLFNSRCRRHTCRDNECRCWLCGDSADRECAHRRRSRCSFLPLLRCQGWLPQGIGLTW